MTDKKNPFENWLNSDVAKSFPSFANVQKMMNNPFDMKTVMESGRKTFQAFGEAQQVTMESLQTIAARQAEIISQMVEDQSAITREILNASSPEEKIARQTDMLRKSYEKTVNNLREVGDMMNKSGREAGDIITKRISASLSEIKSSIETRKEKETSKDSKSRQSAA